MDYSLLDSDNEPAVRLAPLFLSLSFLAARVKMWRFPLAQESLDKPEAEETADQSEFQIVPPKDKKVVTSSTKDEPSIPKQPGGFSKAFDNLKLSVSGNFF